jgi:AAA family ATP:ADP antiporter
VFGFGILLLAIAGHAMLETARDTLFLSDLPTTRLPWAYLSIAVLALGLGSAVNAVLAHRPRRRALLVTLVVGALANVGLWHLVATRRPETLFVLYVWTGLVASIVTLQFWLHAGDLFDVGSAKRVFAFMGAGGLAGATIGSGLAGLVLLVAPPRSLVLGGATLFAASALLTHWWGRFHTAPPRDRASEAPQEMAIGRDPYLGRILVVTLVAAIVATGVDYLFKSSVAAAIPRARLGHFLARYQLVVNGGALVFQLLVAPRLLAGLGVIGALGILPALLFAGTAGAMLTGGFLPVLVVKAIDGTMRHSLDRAGNEILYLPLGAALRERFKAVTTAVGQRGGQALASMALLAIGASGVAHQALAGGLAVISAVWLGTLTTLRGPYVERFRTQLRTFGTGSQGTLPPLDLRSLEVLVTALASSDDAEVVAALDMLEAYGKTALVSPLLVHHPSPVVARRALALLAGSPNEEVLRFVDRLLEHGDDDVRAAVLRMRTTRRPDEALLRRHLRDVNSPAVRCTALIGLIAGRFIDDAEAPAALRAVLESATADSAPTIAHALRDLPPRFARMLAGELSRNPDPRFGTEVARAIAADPSPLFLDTLIDLLAHREARMHARSALVALGAEALERLGAVLGDAYTPPVVRLHVPRTISRFATPRAADILTQHLLAETDDRITCKILRGLGRMRVDDPTVPVDGVAMHVVAERQLARAVTLLAYRVAWDAIDLAGLHRDGGRALLLPRLLLDAQRRALEGVFRALHILEPDAGYAIVFRSLAATDVHAQAGGREMLENLLGGPLRPALLLLTDSLPPPVQLAGVLDFHEPPGSRDLVQAVTRTATDPRRIAAALHAVLPEVIAHLLRESNPILRDVARYQLADVRWPSGAALDEVHDGDA